MRYIFYLLVISWVFSCEICLICLYSSSGLENLSYFCELMVRLWKEDSFFYGLLLGILGGYFLFWPRMGNKLLK